MPRCLHGAEIEMPNSSRSDRGADGEFDAKLLNYPIPIHFTPIGRLLLLLRFNNNNYKKA